jgi:uncharacterized protein YebE (UPF0316 family)
MKVSFRTYAVVNCAFLFLVLAFYVGIITEVRIEERDWDFGDGLNFLKFTVPILALTFLLNAYWTIKSFRDIIQRHDYRSLIALISVIAAWIILYFISFCIS